MLFAPFVTPPGMLFKPLNCLALLPYFLDGRADLHFSFGFKPCHSLAQPRHHQTLLTGALNQGIQFGVKQFADPRESLFESIINCIQPRLYCG